MKWFRFVAMLGCLLASAVSIAESSLYVFIPTDIRANVLQEQLSSVCPDLKVLVFGRGKDFRKEVAKVQPEAIISLLTSFLMPEGAHRAQGFGILFLERISGKKIENRIAEQEIINSQYNN